MNITWFMFIAIYYFLFSIGAQYFDFFVFLKWRINVGLLIYVHMYICLSDVIVKVLSDYSY